MLLKVYDEVTNVLCVSHFFTRQISIRQCNSVQTDPSISSSTPATAVVMSRALTCADVTKECLETNFHLSFTLLLKLCVHYSNGFDNIESVYFFIVTLYNTAQQVIPIEN
jgi:hypothetical protein